MKILIPTVSRSDFGILTLLIKNLRREKKFKINTLVTGEHFSKKMGNTYKEIMRKKSGNIKGGRGKSDQLTQDGQGCSRLLLRPAESCLPCSDGQPHWVSQRQTTAAAAAAVRGCPLHANAAAAQMLRAP